MFASSSFGASIFAGNYGLFTAPATNYILSINGNNVVASISNVYASAKPYGIGRYFDVDVSYKKFIVDQKIVSYIFTTVENTTFKVDQLTPKYTVVDNYYRTFTATFNAPKSVKVAVTDKKIAAVEVKPTRVVVANNKNRASVTSGTSQKIKLNI